MQRLLFFIILMGASSCASICHIDSFLIETTNNVVEIADSDFPCKRKDDFITAAKLTTAAVFSDQFYDNLTNYMKDSISKGYHKAAWKNLEASMIIENMKEKINGTHVTTYGGVKGLWLFIFFNNIAFDGTENGPIKYNRIPLRNRSISQISNTLSHELAHRVGLTHPNSDFDLEVAKLEPPYVIGDMIEQIVKAHNKH